VDFGGAGMIYRTAGGGMETPNHAPADLAAGAAAVAAGEAA